MTDTRYYRPIPQPQGGRWRLAGSDVTFSQFELLHRRRPPEIVDSAPPDILDALTDPRPPLLGLSLDRPRLMGIVNATPDSFSDGGAYDPLAQARLLIGAGADFLDIGGESTRPGAEEVPPAQELNRILPVIDQLKGQIPISVDTRKAQVAESALARGADMVNDVSGFDFDAAMPDLVARMKAPVCIMHAQGLPADMQDDPHYDDVLLDVYDALAMRIARAEAAGITRDRIVIDPGIGFGKTQAHNLAILRRISLFHTLGCPLLLGVSRKRFIGTISGAETPAARMPGTLALTLAAVAQGVQIHRIHDVDAVRQGLALWRAVTQG